jgi:hypothetical protein
VLIDMTPETTATGGVVTRDGQLEAVYLPTFADTKHGSLSVSVQSALTGAMSDELKWLAPTRYEGAEYVASRLIATLAVRRAEKSAGVSSNRDGRIASDVAGLIGRQRPDGGWPWCDDPICLTDPNVTGWALIALGEAQRDGIAVDTRVIRTSTGYVFSYVNRSTDVAHPTRAHARSANGALAGHRSRRERLAQLDRSRDGRARSLELRGVDGRARRGLQLRGAARREGRAHRTREAEHDANDRVEVGPTRHVQAGYDQHPRLHARLSETGAPLLHARPAVPHAGEGDRRAQPRVRDLTSVHAARRADDTNQRREAW